MPDKWVDAVDAFELARAARNEAFSSLNFRKQQLDEATATFEKAQQAAEAAKAELNQAYDTVRAVGREILANPEPLEPDQVSSGAGEQETLQPLAPSP
jgi:exonuclease VII small subunit